MSTRRDGRGRRASLKALARQAASVALIRRRRLLQGIVYLRRKVERRTSSAVETLTIRVRNKSLTD